MGKDPGLAARSERTWSDEDRDDGSIRTSLSPNQWHPLGVTLQWSTALLFQASNKKNEKCIDRHLISHVHQPFMLVFVRRLSQPGVQSCVR